MHPNAHWFEGNLNVKSRFDHRADSSELVLQKSVKLLKAIQLSDRSAVAMDFSAGF